jgi:beta-phosphoglucomutase
VTWGVIFDMDGVIVDTHDAHRAAVETFCIRHGFPFSNGMFEHGVFGLPNRVWLPKLFGAPLSEETLNQFSAEKEAIFRDIIGASARPLPGLPKLLTNLNQVGIPCALASAAPRENIDFILDSIGFTRFFQVILSDNSVVIGKPDPAIFLRAADCLGLRPQDCVVFEDSHAGLTAAHNAGCVVIAVRPSQSIEQIGRVDCTITDFGSIEIEWLAALISRR